ncbi:MAG: thiolase family protein [Reyranella sp.]|jgi:acetyl-CoA acetyltransferase|uniref:thiolase family protein n=1 Tax=Reyranella sp. TaxID=1929291 RepID=UPI000959657E|nr:thiolase family protein [Reyranella sp.]MBN9541548.1 thiolase family protein [Alphaproteobacteria bacterium]MBR2816574.1 thiolase family protein [Reyranella sp.]OJU38560.1 MAG: thiolase [Alphaproteobacteria bacterium 65-37]
MAKILKDLRPVYVVGVGWHRYQPLSDTPYVMLGLPAIRQALADAAIAWPDVESSYIGTGLLGMAAGRAMLKHLGATGRPLVHIENASASGSAAFRHACIEVAAGIADVSLAVGVDKPGIVQRAFTKTGIGNLADDAIVPFTHFALLTNEYADKHGVKPQDVALVAVKNHRNGALNPNAHRQQARSLEEILGGKPVSGTLTALQCCPVGEGAAAVIVASEDAIKRLGIDPGRAIRVTASAASSEGAGAHATADAAITKDTIADALKQASVAPTNVDVLELHDAFTVEELHYVEAMGVCKPGQAIHLLKEGAFDIGGQMAVSPSGGLIAMGHPIGPTGVGQIGEITLQLRGDAGPRQHKGAKVGLAHMVGLGAVCYVHVLERP